MRRILEYQITPEQSGLTIERFLRMKGYSRHVITHLKRTANGITRNGEWVRTRDCLQPLDRLQIQLIEDESSENIEPIQLPLTIIYEDEDLMIINKPADMPIHPSQGNYYNTLANGIAWYFAAQDIPYVYRCINRLDRDTTGLLILAKHMLSGALLSQMIKERRIHRTYLAIVEGHPPMLGTITAPIGRKPGSTIERQVDSLNGETAITHYQVVSEMGDCTLVKLQLETGRTHQIRVHMSFLGHPLVGDSLYNPTSTRMKRQALHSHMLEFEHPITGKAMQFICPLPDDMSW